MQSWSRFGLPSWALWLLAGFFLFFFAMSFTSFSVVKHPTSGNIHDRIVLAGSDVTSGTGLAVVFAVGPQTRLGATATALAIDGDRQNPLAIRLSRMLRLALPISMLAGALVLAGGLLRGQPLWAQL